jgi:acyl transferase domain-containing protein
MQTACSSGLMVVHAACQSLLRGECAMALAGAVSIYVRQKEGYLFQPGGIHSPDGRCRAFDKNAKGTVRGNGLGAVLLKPLVAAQQDGDYIWAVIRGSASNNDGARRVGFTAPSPDGQADVIRRALAAAGVSADSISYVEAHGTGTELGDPTEVEGLKLAFGQSTERREFCAIGSVKTNIGHLNAAAGIAGLIKTVLSLHHGKLPASLNCETPNPLIPFRETPFYVNTIFREWPEGSSPRRAGVSSFGVGGTNVHVVLEAAARREIPARHERCQLLSISADSEAALRDAALKLAEHLTSHKDLALADVAYTLHTGRNDRSHRQLLVCSTIGEAIEGLNSPSGSVIKGQAPRQTISVGLFFPGHAGECVGWGRCLYQSNAAFRDTLDECAARLRRHRSVNLLEYLYPEFRHQEITEPDLNSLPVAQCALFAVEYAMARTLLELGVSPNWMLGDNLGEYVAACLSGVFSLDDALFLVCYRAQLMQDAASFTGSILSKFASAVEAVPRRTPAIPFLSGLTGDWIETRDAMSTAYWVDHLCQSMPFSDALTKALKIPHTIFLDCGPKPSLACVLQSMNSEPGSKQIVAVASRTDEHPSSEVRALITAIGRLWLAGAQIDWAAFYKGQDGRVVPLPAYPFQRSRYWVDPEAGSSVHANPERSIA